MAEEPTPISQEQHYTCEQLGQLWNIDEKVVRRWALDEPGVLSWSVGETKTKRGKLFIRVPASVAARIHASHRLRQEKPVTSLKRAI